MGAGVLLVCSGCGAAFERRAAEVRRQRKVDPERAFYCSRSCYATSAGKHNLGDQLGRGEPARLEAGNRQDEYSAFRYFMRKARNRGHATDLDLAYLAELWEAQAGRCALSGAQMVLPRNTLAWERDTKNPWKPSLDRTDSALGYVKGNVRFVTVIGNLAKAGFSDDDVLAFCRAVAAHHGG